MAICLERGADLHTAQLMPLPLTVSCFSKIQIGFTFLVPAHPGSPGKGPLTCVVITWETPARAWWAFFWSPQLPVANEYLRPSVMIRVLIASSRLKSFPRSINFWAYRRISFVRFRNSLKHKHKTVHRNVQIKSVSSFFLYFILLLL